jgi:hypothetical protein
MFTTWRRRQSSGNAGMVTAETAIVMPAVVLLLTVVLFAGRAVIDQVRCIDAARAGARLAARGEPSTVVAAAVRRIAPAQARMALSDNGSEAIVTVASEARVPLAGWAVLPLRGSATAQIETSLDPPLGPREAFP